MEKNIILFNKRKCMSCGAITTDMGKTVCDCGKYMYSVGIFFEVKNNHKHVTKNN